MQDNWDTLRAQIAYFSKPFPRAAIAFANEHRAEVAPHLVDVLARVAANPAIVIDDPDYILHEYAMHLLGAWADTRAYAPLVALGHLDEDTLEGVLGDCVTEVYGRCLATVCDGDLEPLKKLFEDTRASYWSRGAALEAMVVRVMEGADTRDALVQYLAEQGDQQAQRLRTLGVNGRGLEVINDIARSACDLAAVALRERIDSWFDGALLDERVVDKRWVDFCLGQSFEFMQQTVLESGRGYMRDVEAEMGWWAGFKDEPVRSSVAKPLTGDEALLAQARARLNPPPIETVVRSGPKIGRNDPCPCGSGKKFKKCCGAG